MTTKSNSDLRNLPACPDCGEPLDRHCVVYPHDGPLFFQCQTTPLALDEEEAK